jgi:4-amino-4-deoxy-L-arabinose transferase-like glycosyltransferase
VIKKIFQSPRGLLWLTTAIVLAVQTVWFTQSAAIQGFATGDGGVKLWQVQGILQTGDLNAPLDYKGALYDPEHQYAPFVQPWAFEQNGRFYTEYTSPFIWATVPLYAAFSHAGLMILPWLGGLLLVIMAAWLAWRVRPDRWASLVPLIVGFSSPLSIYSLEFWEHTVGTALAVFALLGLVKALTAQRRWLWLLLSGAALGLGLTMRAELYVYPIAIVIGLLLIRSAYRLPLARSLIWLAAGGLIVAGPWWLYQFMTWGSPFGPRVAQNVPLLGGSEMLARLGDTTGHNYAMLWPLTGNAIDVLTVLLIAAAILALGLRLLRRWQQSESRLYYAGFWSLAAILVGLAIITAWRVFNWQAAIGQRPDDLLTTFPVILFLLLPLPLADRTLPRSAFDRLLLVVSITFVVLVLVISPFHGGIQWGPRFLLPIIVPLTVVIVDRLARMEQVASHAMRPGLLIVFAALLAAGLCSTLTGVRFMQDGQRASAWLGNYVENRPEQVVVTDTWFIPQSAPYTLRDKIWLMAESKHNMIQLIQQLRKQTDEPGMLYISSLTWAHLDPQILLGPRIAPNGEPQYVNAPTQYLQITPYLLLK